RILVTSEHKKGVVDPMTSSLVRVPGNGELLGPDACRGGSSIFDGRLRYDLKLDFKRMETVKADKGYHGPAVVCAVYFTPVAGYIPDRPVIKYLAGERRMEIVLVPIAGTRILVPFRMTIPTPFGPAVLEATHVHPGGEDAVTCPVMAGHSRSKNGVASLRLCPGQPRLWHNSKEDVDARGQAR